MVATDREEEHPKSGEDLAETAEEECDKAEATMQFFVIGLFVDANANLFQTETDDRSKQTKNADCLRIDGQDRHDKMAPFWIVYGIMKSEKSKFILSNFGEHVNENVNKR